MLGVQHERPVGDICLGGRVSGYTSKYGYDYPYRNVQSILGSADLNFGNLECALSSRGRPAHGKKFTFRGSQQNANFLKKAGFSVVSVANNHSKDSSNQAFLDTLDALRKGGIIASGGGQTASEAYKLQIIEVEGTRVAFILFSDILPWGFAATTSNPSVASPRNQKLVLQKIKEARQEADFVIVSIHWGKELSVYPSKKQIALAHRMVDGGTDLILGHRPHVAQGIEVYKERVIAYSLGNFIFSPGSSEGRPSLILNVKVEQGKISAMQVYPVYIDGIQPRVLTGKRGQAWLKEIIRRSQPFKTPLSMETSTTVPILNG